MLLGLLREGEGVAARVLENLGADPSNIRTQVSQCPLVYLSSKVTRYKKKNNDKLCWFEQVIRMVGESTEAVGVGAGQGTSGNKMPTLEEYGTNLTKLAEEVSWDILLMFVCRLSFVMLLLFIVRRPVFNILYFILAFSGKAGSCCWKTTTN